MFVNFLIRLNALLIGTQDGNVHLFAYGVLPIALVDLSVLGRVSVHKMRAVNTLVNNLCHVRVHVRL